VGEETAVCDRRRKRLFDLADSVIRSTCASGNAHAGSVWCERVEVEQRGQNVRLESLAAVGMSRSILVQLLIPPRYLGRQLDVWWRVLSG